MKILLEKKWIDVKFKSAGWTTIIPYSEKLDLLKPHKVAIEELPTEAGPADYVLFLHGQLVVNIEAKKLSLGPQNLLVQAQRYVRGLNIGLENIEAMEYKPETQSSEN